MTSKKKNQRYLPADFILSVVWTSNDSRGKRVVGVYGVTSETNSSDVSLSEQTVHKMEGGGRACVCVWVRGLRVYMWNVTTQLHFLSIHGCI